MRSQFELLSTKRFLPYFLTQLLGAFNDNLYKNALFIMIAFGLTREYAVEPDVMINIAAGLFILPFFLFSAFAGQLADKFEKSKLIQVIKIAEIGIMALAAVAFYFKSVVGLIAVLFLMGSQSTFFGPIKYSILPQHLKVDELMGGNGLVETGTFVAILLGSITGGILISYDDFGMIFVSLAVIIFAGLGWLTAKYIPEAEAAQPDLKLNYNPLSDIWQTLKRVKKRKTVFQSILGISWFWFLGATLLAQMPAYTHNFIGGNELVVNALLVVFTVGIAVGSLLCHRLGRGKIEIGLVPFGSIGLSIFAFDLGFAHGDMPTVLIGPWEFFFGGDNIRVIIDLLMLGVFGGLYIVPLYAIIQRLTASRERSRIIAGNNFINAFFMLVSSLMAVWLLSMNLEVIHVFLVISVLNALVAIYIYRLVPHFLVRFVVWLLVQSVYRVRAKHTEFIPEDGAAILACNHVSFVDPMIVMACSTRPIRFIMDYGFYKLPIAGFFFRMAGAIPITSARANKEIHDKALEEVSKALRNGQLVGIFPEGMITRTGDLNPFRPGIERILETDPVPVIPVAVQGLWGSFFSRRFGKAMFQLPRKFLWAKIGLNVGPPIKPEDVSKEKLFETIRNLRGDWR